MLHYTVGHTIIVNLKIMFCITLFLIWLPFLTIKLYFLTFFFLSIPTNHSLHCFWKSHLLQTLILPFLHRSHYRRYFQKNVLKIAMLASQSWIKHSSQPTDFQNCTLLVSEARIAKIEEGWFSIHFKGPSPTLNNTILEARIWLADIVHSVCIVHGIHIRGNLIGVTQTKTNIRTYTRTYILYTYKHHKSIFVTAH